MPALLDHDLAPRRFTARLTAGFTLLALLLALIGVYGVMSYVVAQRAREIGIRMALGAARGEVVRLVLGRGLRIVAAGTGLGLVAALSRQLRVGSLREVPRAYGPPGSLRKSGAADRYHSEMTMVTFR